MRFIGDEGDQKVQGSAVAAGAALGRLNVPIVDKFLAFLDLSGRAAWMLPIEIGDKFGVADEFLRGAMALQTPTHG